MEIPTKLVGIIILILGIVITGWTESYVDSQIPNEYEIINDNIVKPLSDYTEDSCKNVKCIESVNRIRTYFDILGVGFIVLGILGTWKGK